MMFNIFGKRKNIKEEDYEFLKSIADSLSLKYPYLINQVTKEFILDKKINEHGDAGTYTLILNAELERKFSRKSLPQFFIIKDIQVWNKVTNRFELIELHILEGLLAGYRVISSINNLALDKIDLSSVKERHFKNEDKEELKIIMGKVDKNLLTDLEMETTFKIEIDEGIFYIIKDLEDGNYIAVSQTGEIYGLIHDPYQVDKIYNNINSFLLDLKEKKFSFKNYIESKLN